MWLGVSGAKFRSVEFRSQTLPTSIFPRKGHGLALGDQRRLLANILAKNVDGATFPRKGPGLALGDQRRPLASILAKNVVRGAVAKISVVGVLPQTLPISFLWQATRAESQWILAARPLCHLQYPIAYLSRLQRIIPVARCELRFKASRRACLPCKACQRHVPLEGGDPLLLVGKRTKGARVASSPDSDLEAFSHNPTHGSFAPLAFQPSTMTNYVPPQLNSPLDNVFRPDRPAEASLGSKKRGSASFPIHGIIRLESSSTGSSFPANSAKLVPLDVVSLDSRQGQWESLGFPLSVPVLSRLFVGRGRGPEGPIPSPSPDRPATTHSRGENSSSSPPTADGFGIGTPMPSSQSQSFFRGYGSILLTSLAYIVPPTRGYSPWRPDAVMSTTGRGRHSVLQILKGRWRRTGNHATCGALLAAGPYLRLSRF
ncbi:hypothetical protein Fmac_032992 [Flemingia macrophylla]|uniref:Uncharacterized protein n=1 Tax=Flemingia macrophylla TaxID=520843 RepID=A0ABD1L6J4_9FABA